MKIDIEHGIANEIYRAFAAFRPVRPVPQERFTPEIAVQRYGRGNIYLQTGRIMTDEEYERQRERVLAYEF